MAALASLGLGLGAPGAVQAAKHTLIPARFTGPWVEARVACGASEEVYETTIDQNGVYSEALEAWITGARVLGRNQVEIDTLVSFQPPARGTSLLTLSHAGQRMTMRVVADGGKRLPHEDALVLKRCPGLR
jgi:hypothetical protein